MASAGYNLFCPLARACEVLERRWTLLILLELWNGSTRFNELRRGVPGISPTLLSRRLKEMEAQGLVERVEDRAKGTVDYLRTPMAVELEAAMDQLGQWAYRHMGAEVALDTPDPDYLMWNLRRKVDPAHLPARRVVVRFRFTDGPKGGSSYWLVVRPGAPVDLCKSDPGFDVDLYVDAELAALASVWMRHMSWRAALDRGSIGLSGDARLARSIDKWLLECGYACAAA